MQKYNYVIVTFEDEREMQAEIAWTLKDQAETATLDFDSWKETLEAVTDAKITAIQMVTTFTQAGTLGDGPYRSVDDRLMIIGTVGGKATPFEIPAPKAGIFQVDTLHLDLENDAVENLEFLLHEWVGSKTGQEFTNIRRGVRQTVKRKPIA